MVKKGGIFDARVRPKRKAKKQKQTPTETSIETPTETSIETPIEIPTETPKRTLRSGKVIKEVEETPQKAVKQKKAVERVVVNRAKTRSRTVAEEITEFLDEDINNKLDKEFESFKGSVPTIKELSKKTGINEDLVKEWYKTQPFNQIFQKPSPKARKLYNKYNNGVPWKVLEFDILFMPADKSRKYILSGVDTATRFKFAIPMTRKTSYTTTESIKQLKIDWKKVKQVNTDAGGEFKKEFEEFLKSKGIKHHVALPSEHLGMVENTNKLLAEKLFSQMSLQEFKNKKTNRKWVDNLPNVVEELNNTKNSAIKMTPKKAMTFEYIPQSKNRFAIKDLQMFHPLGTIVRRLLNRDEVLDIATDKLSVGRKRATDPKWTIDTFEVIAIFNKPDEDKKYTNEELKERVEADLPMHKIMNVKTDKELPHYYNYFQLMDIKNNI
jgi:hypothetical protein